jgi:malonate decarboxylase alpha subunit
VPRVDIPGDWIDIVVPSASPYVLEPLFTRDPAKIREDTILMAMMAIKAVYKPYQVRCLNHGIGYATAAIELILPTFGAEQDTERVEELACPFVTPNIPNILPLHCTSSEAFSSTSNARANAAPVDFHIITPFR